MAIVTSQKKLNPEQLEAINHKKGPLLIIAGAGTGKTTVITERVKNLLVSGEAKVDEILALTFTEKAAREMEERVDIALPYGYTQMWISTFHSFCDRVLRQEALQIGLDTRYKLMSQAEAVQLIRQNIFSFELEYFRPLGNPNRFIGAMLSHFSRLQDENVTPLEYLKWAKDQRKDRKATKNSEFEVEKYLELAKAYQAYDELKTREGRMDFGDLVVKTLKLFNERPNVLNQYQQRFKYFLIDEFQDTNHAQNELALLLAGKNGNITVVGDDDQAVYRFRGAAISNILYFRKVYPKAKIVVLTRNYRSNQEILDRAYELIQHNNPDRLEVVEKINKKLTSERKEKGDDVEFIHVNRAENEAEEVAKKILEITSTSQNYKNVAILVRANNHADPFMRSLSRYGIPYQFLGPGRLFRQPEVVDLIAYLKVLYDLEDSASFYRLITFPYFEVSGRDLASLGSFARKQNLSLFEASEKIADISMSDSSAEKITNIVTIIKSHLDRLHKDTAGELLYDFLDKMNLLPVLLSPENIEVQRRAQNISKFFDKLKTYEVEHEDATVPAVVDWIELSSELGESPLASNMDWYDVNAVNILTVHSAKGLEFPNVFLVNLVAQRFPTSDRSEPIPIPEALIKEVLPKGDFHLQEERRLFYVGMTRARDRLFLTAADYYGEGKREKKLSPFIFEALGDKATAAEKPLESEQLSFMDFATQDASKEKPEALHIDYLSYSQIETFRICPLHYRLRYILKIPTPPTAPLSFGISIHETLKDFYLKVKGEKDIEKFLEEAIETNWIREGYLNKRHQEESSNKAKKLLSNYIKKHFNPSNLPLLVEQPFVVPLQTNKEFSRPLKIGGKIDRVDKTSKGIEIIDYKTGSNVPTQKEVDSNLQLTFYALAATTLPDYPFGKKPEEVTLKLHYLEADEILSTRRTKEELVNAKNEIFRIREEIEKSDFKCNGNILCQQKCEYYLMCRS